MSHKEYFSSPSKQCKKTFADLSNKFARNKTNWCNYCSELYPIKKKPKYIEGYMFEDSDDTDSATDHSPLVRQQPSDDDTLHRHTHIITGYLSMFEVVVLLVYLIGGIIGLVRSDTNHHGSCSNETDFNVIYKHCFDKFLIGMMCMVHSFLWLIIACFDRIIQWQHQVIRRKGYLKFYRKMKNLRRIPFIIFSFGTAALLIFVSVLYLFSVSNELRGSSSFKVKYFMFIIFGLEMLVSITALLLYILQAVLFNIRRPPPDVIQDTASIANSPTATLTTVGFRDGEDLDELLERQADMIRYLQQHNASLGRRIMELQSRTIE